MFFDPMYFVFLAPAMLLMAWAQWRIQANYKSAQEIPANLSGAAAARYILDRDGLQEVGIEETHGHLSDHYDPSHRVLRLSSEVYHGRNAAAVGIAAHEAGHALQHAHNYTPLVLRNAAVPAAQFGPWAFIVLLVLGLFMANPFLIQLGIIAYGGLAVFQLINLPVEFDASARAKVLLSELGIVDGQGAQAVNGVLNSAAWTYVAATLESLLTVAYYAMRFGGMGSSDD